MLSRVAETIYWMARYMERTKGLLQTLRTNYISSQDDVNEFSWKPFLTTFTSLKAKQIEEIENNTLVVFDYVVLNRHNPFSAVNHITSARENARSIQDHITKEVWQCLNDYYHNIRDTQIEKQIKFGDPVTALDLLIRQNFMYIGTVDITMSRGEGSTYLKFGRFLERAVQTTDITRIKLGELHEQLQHPEEIPSLRYLLYSLFGYEQYIKEYRGNIQPENLLQHVLTNEDFPHSIVYSLQQMDRYFKRLQSESLPESFAEIEYLIGKTMNKVRYNSIKANDSEAVNTFLLDTKKELYEIASALSSHYFGYK
jgi:uncharacterized alpha-E superfamily protein